MTKTVPLMDADLHSISPYHDVWLKMAFKIIGKDDTDKANELVHNMYLRLSFFFEKKKVDKVSSLYIYKTLRNLFYNSSKEDLIECPTDDMTVFEELEDNQDTLNARKKMSERLQEIPFLEREVLLQTQEKSQRKLAKETGTNRKRLRLYQNRAMDRLKELYQDEIKLKKHG